MKKNKIDLRGEIHKRYSALWYRLLDQMHNQMRFTQTNQEPDVRVLNSVYSLIEKTFRRLISLGLTEGTKTIIEKQYSVVKTAFTFMLNYEPKKVDRLVDLREELEKLMKIRL